MPRRGGRLNNGSWGRLKPIQEDPLDKVGLLSKGDKTLLDPQEQKKYYMAIIDKFLAFVTDAGDKDVLLGRFAALDINRQGPSSATPSSPSNAVPSSSAAALSPATSSTSAAAESSATALSRVSQPTSETMSALQSPDNTKPLSDIMMALRKLREGLFATKRADEFATQAYIFNIRLAILVHHPESYQPAILHLLRYIAVWHPLNSVEIEEVAGYLILDAACRRRQLAEAHMIRRDFKVKDKYVFMILHALAHDNWVLFHELKRRVDGHKRRLMEYADDEMRLHTLKCFGRAYLSVDLEYLQKATDRKWKDLKEKDGVGWELDGEQVIIRRVRAK